MAHECILTGTTAKEITIYNTCLANKTSKKSNQSVTNSVLKSKIEKLKNENLSLKNKLLDLKIRFDSFKSILDIYAKN